MKFYIYFTVLLIVVLIAWFFWWTSTLEANAPAQSAEAATEILHVEQEKPLSH